MGGVGGHTKAELLQLINVRSGLDATGGASLLLNLSSLSFALCARWSGVYFTVGNGDSHRSYSRLSSLCKAHVQIAQVHLGILCR